MKKIIVLLLSLSLFMCIGVSAMAVEDDRVQIEAGESIPEPVVESMTSGESKSTVQSETSKEIEESSVTVSSETEDKPVVDPSENSTDVVSDTVTAPRETAPMNTALDGNTYNVEISWKGMKFTYCEKTMGKWSPESLSYVGGSDAHWESSDEGKGYGTFTITNKDSQRIKVDFKFVSRFPEDVFMRFSTSETDLVTTYPNNKGTVTVDKEGISYMYAVPAVSSGANPKEQIKETIGTVTITVGPDVFTDPPSPEGPGIE